MKGKRTISLLLTLAGSLLLLSALGLVLYNIRDAHRAADASEQVLEELKLVIPEPSHSQAPAAIPAESTSISEQLVPEQAPPEEIPDYILSPHMDMPEQVIDGSAYIGTLEIPALDLTLPVASSWSYDLLKKTPCRYAGSAYTDDLVIAAHNYSSHFGGLTKLSLDSEIRFTDIDGNVFVYGVTDLETLEATAVEEMTEGPASLTLFTCTIGGEKRIAVRAERIDSESTTLKN